MIQSIVTTLLVAYIALARPTEPTDITRQTGNTLFGTTLVTADSELPHDHDGHGGGEGKGYELRELTPEQDIIDISAQDADPEKAVVLMSPSNGREPARGRVIEIGSFPGMLKANGEFFEDRNFEEEEQKPESPLYGTDPEIGWRRRPLPPVNEDVEPGSNTNDTQQFE